MNPNVTSPLTRRAARTPLEVRADVTELIARYCYGLDLRDIDLFHSVWHPEAIWNFGVSGCFEGWPSIEAAVGGFWQTFTEMHHLSTDILVDLTDGGANSLSHAWGWARFADGREHQLVARYRDSLVHIAGRWVFMRRDIEMFPPFPLEA